MGGYELALDPTDEKIIHGNSPLAYWGVQDIHAAMASCAKAEAIVDSEIKDVGGEIKVATVRDPFGNTIGMIENPHFKVEN